MKNKLKEELKWKSLREKVNEKKRVNDPCFPSFFFLLNINQNSSRK